MWTSATCERAAGPHHWPHVASAICWNGGRKRWWSEASVILWTTSLFGSYALLLLQQTGRQSCLCLYREYYKRRTWNAAPAELNFAPAPILAPDFQRKAQLDFQSNYFDVGRGFGFKIDYASAPIVLIYKWTSAAWFRAYFNKNFWPRKVSQDKVADLKWSSDVKVINMEKVVADDCCWIKNGFWNERGLS